MMKRLFVLLLSAMIALSSCSGATSENEDKTDTSAPNIGGTNGTDGTNGAAAADGLDEDDFFSSRDLSGEYDADGAVTVELSGESVTLTEAGVYILSGKIGNGSIIVEADKSDKLQLVLAGVDVACEGSAALYVKSADKVFLTLAEGTENSISSTGTFVPDGDVNVDGAIFSREDITVNGKGALTVTSSDHGIVSKDDLDITGGKLTVEAESHALSGKDSVGVAGGELLLTAGGDGIHSDNSEDASRGNILICGGSVIARCGGDGVDGSGTLQITDGSLDIVSGGGSENGEQHTNDMWGGFGSRETGSTDTVSKKGIKSDTALIIAGGEVKTDSADDALHSNGTVTISGGTVDVRSGDDGIHAEAEVTISGGTVNVRGSYEGIEGKSITVSGGEIDVTATDDGFNATDGTGDIGGMGPGGFGGFGGFGPGGSSDNSNDSDGYGDVYLLISGGKIHVDAGGDGLDSNGGLYVTGGETYVDGPTNSGNGALDFGSEAVISGGVVVAVGASGMAENFGASSTQGAIMYNVTGGGDIVLTDGDGKTLAEFSPSKSYNSVVVSAPGIEVGGTYTLTVGGSSYSIKMDSIVYGAGGMGGGPGGMGRPGGWGGGPGGRR